MVCSRNVHTILERGGRRGSKCPAFSGVRKNSDACEGIAHQFKEICPRGMVPSPTPKRDHGDPQAFRLRSEGHLRSWYGRRDLNPHGPCGPTEFPTRLRLSPLRLSCSRGLGPGLLLLFRGRIVLLCFLPPYVDRGG